MRLLEGIVPFREREAQDHRVLVVNGHTDPRPERFCAALCDAYEGGARTAGWALRRLSVGSLVGKQDRELALAYIGWSTRLMVVCPLWLDQSPAPLRDLFEA